METSEKITSLLASIVLGILIGLGDNSFSIGFIGGVSIFNAMLLMYLTK